MIKYPVVIFGGLVLGSGIALYAQPAAKPKYVPIHPARAAKPTAQNPSRSVSQAALNKAAAKPLGANPTSATASTPPTFERDVLPVVQKYCVSCHVSPDPTADLDLDKYKTVASVLKNKGIWQRVVQNVHSSHMPPAKMPQPTRAQRERLVQCIETILSKDEAKSSVPARVTMRRLNREEYNNTIRDLLAVDFKPAADFPSDDIGYGFDNIGDVLSISPLLMEKYLNAAEKIAMQAVVAPDANIRIARFDAQRFTPDKDASFNNEGSRVLASTAEVGIDYNFPEAGEYSIRARAYGQQAGDEAAKMELKLNGESLKVFDVAAVEGASETYEHRLRVPAGRHRVTVTFTNDFYEPERPEGQRDRNLIVEALAVEGPRLIDPPPTPTHLKIMPRPVTAATSAEERSRYAREIMGKLARRAYRRPVTPDEVERLARYIDMAQKDGDSFERGVQIAIQAMLVSPHFLFRIERDAVPLKIQSNAKARVAARKLNDFELASRLSYFLWSSMPDDSLMWWADKGKLSEPQHLLHQVRRMLKDSKAGALAGNFAMQWLELRRLNDFMPDPELFPDFTPELRVAMQTETVKFCEEIIREDRSIIDFLDAKFTYVNEPLAKHYGIPDIKGPEFKRVVFTGPQARQRGGLLTQASVLTVTSNPTRTSPVKRGKWVLEQVLGAAPPPPPPDVPDLSEDKKVINGATMRQRMVQHREDPGCASCHARMDPIGFGLENYDAIGAWRTKEGRFPVDASGELAGGYKFNGAAELKNVLKSRKDEFARCLAEKMLTYSLGRGLERSDKPTVDAITKSVATDDYRFSALVLAVVQSEPFRNKRMEAVKK